MRSYKNQKGEIIEVSQEHLDTAVRIKRELQMASPSHRCNWNEHKRLMEKEGYFDSEASESYRQMIKSYQASTGTLESREKQADIISSSKLMSIKEAVGELYYVKREAQLENLKLGKLKRELTLLAVISEQVRQALLEELNEAIPDYAYQERLPVSLGRMIVLISDWHIGATVVNVLGNWYNYSIARKRVAKFINRINEIARKEEITEIDVVCLGDMTEHVSMRKNQSFGAEFPLSVQIVKAYELIRDFLVNLSKSFNVTYRGVGGNHDRMNGIKEDNLDGDSTIYVINYMIREFIEKAKAPRIRYYECDSINYSSSFSVKNFHMKFIHGDNEKGNKILASHSNMDDVNYHVVAMGHLHRHEVREVGQNKFEVYVGSLEGVNNYSMKGKFVSGASQGVIIVNKYGEIDIRRIDLQIV